MLSKQGVITGHDLKRTFGTKCKLFKFQRPRDSTHIDALCQAFIEQKDSLTHVVGQFIFARTKEETEEDSAYSVLDGTHRWHALIQLSDDEPILNCMFSYIAYENASMDMQKQIFRIVNSGLPLSGMYYDEQYLRKMSRMTMRKLKEYYPRMFTDEPYILWNCTYSESLIEELFTVETMELLKINNLTSASITDLLVDLNHKIVHSCNTIIGSDDWYKSEDQLNQLTHQNWDDMFDWYRYVTSHKQARSSRGLEKILKHAARQYMCVKGRKALQKRKPEPFLLTLVAKSCLIDLLQHFDVRDAEYFDD